MIVFARHGETLPNREGLVLGRADPGLTDEGRRQAGCLARLLAPEEPVAVLTSPLRRAVETAGAIASAAGLEAEVDERLVELDWGRWEGRAAAGIGRDEFEGLRAGDDAAPGGESLRSVGERMASFCTDLLAGDGMVVAVSHVSPIKAAVAWAIGAPDDVAWRMFCGIASVTRIGRGARGPTLVSFNETAHLAR